MTQPPRRIDQHLLRRETIIDLLWSGFLMGLLPFGAFLAHIMLSGGSLTEPMTPQAYAIAATVSYVSILFCQYANILSRRAGDDSIFTPYIRSNTRLLWSLVISIILVIGITYIPAISSAIGS
jgi:Ca2+-transporting ATPase